MSIANFAGTFAGNSAAYTKHAVLATGIGGVGFVKEVAQSAALAYATKDAELAARRDEMRQLANNVELAPRAPRASTRKAAAAAADVTDVKAK